MRPLERCMHQSQSDLGSGFGIEETDRTKRIRPVHTVEQAAIPMLLPIIGCNGRRSQPLRAPGRSHRIDATRSKGLAPLARLPASPIGAPRRRIGNARKPHPLALQAHPHADRTHFGLRSPPSHTISPAGRLISPVCASTDPIFRSETTPLLKPAIDAADTTTTTTTQFTSGETKCRNSSSTLIFETDSST